ncbi:hypothetical protein RM844_32365, partial [Streptomyces sp. DSM 44915]
MMKRLSVLLAASTFALAACTSAPPPTETDAAPGAAQPETPETIPTPIATYDFAAGQKVYSTFCAACNSGADDTAPELPTIRTFTHTRVSTALSEGGLMT